MSKFKVSIKKGSPTVKAAKLKAGAAVVDFVIQDNQNSTCTVNGVDAAGNAVDISSVATIAVTSSDPTIITVGPVTGMTFTMTAVGSLSVPGTPVGISVVATWNDGSVGPFSFTLPCDVVAGPASGVVIVPGTPVANP